MCTWMIELRRTGARWGAVVLLGLLAVGIDAAAQIDAQEIYEEARPAVVLVQAALTGTGFIVRPNGCIFTAAHVVGSESREEITVHLYDGRSFENVKIVSFDNKNDIAVLKVDAEGLPWVELGESDEVRELDEVVVIGYPKPEVLLTDQPTADVGRVQAIRETVSYNFGHARHGRAQLHGLRQPDQSRARARALRLPSGRLGWKLAAAPGARAGPRRRRLGGILDLAARPPARFAETPARRAALLRTERRRADRAARSCDGRGVLTGGLPLLLKIRAPSPCCRLRTSVPAATTSTSATASRKS